MCVLAADDRLSKRYLTDELAGLSVVCGTRAPHLGTFFLLVGTITFASVT